MVDTAYCSAALYCTGSAIHSSNKSATASHGVKILLALLLILATLWLPGAYAADTDAKLDVNTVLDNARVEIDAIQEKLKSIEDKPLDNVQLGELREASLDAQSDAEAAAASIEPQLKSLQARLLELGVPAEDAPEATDIAVQRKQLLKDVSTMDAQIKLGRLIAVEAGQAAEQILKLRRSQFQAQLGVRSSSIAATSFWGDLAKELPRDLRRLQTLRVEVVDVLQSASALKYGATALAVVVVLILRMLAGRTLMRMSTTLVAPGRLRRSLYAAVLVLLAIATPGLIAAVLHASISWNDDVSPMLRSLLDQLVGIASFGGFVAGLGYALLAPDRPSWRLPRISDELAVNLRWFPLLLAIVVSVGWAAQRLSVLVNASLVASVAMDCILALLIAIVIAAALRRLRTFTRATPGAADHATVTPLPMWFNPVLNLAWAAVIISIGSLLTGYVALGSFVAKQLVWAVLVLGSTYLLTGLIDDACTSLLAANKRSNGDSDSSDTFSRVRSQAMVLLSGAARLLLVLFAFMLLLSPFGGGPGDWLRQVDHLRDGIAIGQVQIRPTAVLNALFVLVLGLGAVKLVQRWLATQYLPTTSLDPGMRLSAATLFGYAGYVLAIAFSLSAVGISLERVAWIASALSVGIGFGLQAVVQNFVSGLILLAERPVRVGDWVSLGTVEGDIRRINVRATEIQMGDRSTVIVPNSEFITKVVRNVTHANPLGRVQIKLALPVNTDAEQVHDLMLGAFHDHDEILPEPAAEVMLDGVDNTGLVFNATAYVSSPRSAYGVRSALLFEILKRLRAADLPLVNPPTMVLKELQEPAMDAPEISAYAAAEDSGTQSRDNPVPRKD